MNKQNYIITVLQKEKIIKRPNMFINLHANPLHVPIIEQIGETVRKIPYIEIEIKKRKIFFKKRI